jgi:hypothetical protein
MRKLMLCTVLVVGNAGCSNNEPQYVQCAPMGAAMLDVCRFTAGEDDGMGNTARGGSLHVPIMPEADWKAEDRARRMELQMEVDATGAIVVPVFRLEHYDLSVEWIVRNLTDTEGTFEIGLNGANEEFAYDPSMIMLGDERDPPAPSLSGDIPTRVPGNGSVSGVFREDQMREAAIDLDQITRGNINMFAAVLTINKQADAFQPVTPLDVTTDPPTGGEPTGPAVPAAAWRQFVRIDILFDANRLMEIEYSLRLREHTEIIHEEGLNAPAAELQLIDPPYYQASLP